MSDTTQQDRLYSLQEASAQCGLAPYIVRYWEIHFPELGSGAGKGKSQYTASDIALLWRIKKLLYVDRLTIEQAKQQLSRERAFPVQYPGGAALDQMARTGTEGKYTLPVGHVHGCDLDMSFSGLKTAALNLIHHAEQIGEPLDIPGLCADFSRAVSDTLVPRTMEALWQTGYRKLAIAGGVAANSRIRGDFEASCAEMGVTLYKPPLKLCGDNGAMIGSQGYYEFLAGHTAGQELNAYATRSIEA